MCAKRPISFGANAEPLEEDVDEERAATALRVHSPQLGELSQRDDCDMLNSAKAEESCPMDVYEEVVGWKKKFFLLPNNAIGRAFVDELASQLSAFVNSGGSNKDALFNFFVLPSLLLQAPASGCTYKEATQHLKRRMPLWQKGAISELVEEGRCLQKQFCTKQRGGRLQGEEDRARHFGDFISSGRVHDALRMLTDESSPEAYSSGNLKMDEMVTLGDGTSTSVRDVLLEKHPQAEPAAPEILLDDTVPPVHDVCFESLTPALLKNIALHSEGSAGPSGLNAVAWRRICSSHKGASVRMCQALSGFAKLLATRALDAAALVPFLSCRLIALDKKPGVRPIGVCEVPRRIVAKAILSVVKSDVTQACGFLQKCSGTPAGIEAAIHAMRQIYEDESTEGILLVDARNAFNALNRKAALHNVQRLCPSLSRTLLNCYSSPSRLFVAGGGEIASQEGTTQGDPLSMPFYALATVPLIQHLQKEHRDIRQIWYADDSGGGGRLRILREWWTTLSSRGRLYGYHTNSTKTVLLVRPHLLSLAQELFEGTGVVITTDGARCLGSVIGDQKFVDAFLAEKVLVWEKELRQLATFAKSEPQAAFAALSHGLRGRYVFILRTVPKAGAALQPLDVLLQKSLLPTMTDHSDFSEDEITLLKLPARLGGVGLPCLSEIGLKEYDASLKVTAQQVKEIVLQNVDHDIPSFERLFRSAVRARAAIRLLRRKQEMDIYQSLVNSSISCRLLTQLSAKGASAWLTVLPLKEHGFRLSKSDFWDALALRYDWPLKAVPLKCVCSKDFSPDHAMICPCGGYPTIRHNELRDVVGTLLSEVCHNVAIEPKLVPLSGEVFRSSSTNTAEDARADVRAAGFWTRGQDAYFDVRVFHANAPSYRSKNLEDLFRQHEQHKRLEYEERIVNIERGSFCPLVFTTTGTPGPLCERFMKRLAGQLAEKNELLYSSVIAWLRCRVSFAMLRSAVMCVRGSRSSRGNPVLHDVELAIVESRVSAASQ